MKTVALALALATVGALVCASSAPAQVLIQRDVIYGSNPLDLSIDGLLGPDVSLPLATPVGEERVLSFPSVIETAPVPSPVYVPGIYVPGRYSRVDDLNSIVLPFTNW